jgi:hypothetical protein
LRAKAITASFAVRSNSAASSGSPSNRSRYVDVRNNGAVPAVEPAIAVSSGPYGYR